MVADYITLEARNGDLHVGEIESDTPAIDPASCGVEPTEPGPLGSGGDVAHYGSANGLWGNAGPGQGRLYPDGTGTMTDGTVDITIQDYGATAFTRIGAVIVRERGLAVDDNTFARSSIRTPDNIGVKVGELPLGVPFRLQINGFDPAILIGVGPFAQGVTQTDIDAYNVAKSIYDLCIAEAEASKVGSGLSLLTNADGIANRLKQSLLLRKESCLYDLDAGFAWDRITGVQNRALIESLLRQHIQALPFITDIESLSIIDQPNSRTMNIAITVRTFLGESVTVAFDTLNI